LLFGQQRPRSPASLGEILFPPRSGAMKQIKLKVRTHEYTAFRHSNCEAYAVAFSLFLGHRNYLLSYVGGVHDAKSIDMYL
jgi:hypothetical protein